MLYRIVLYCIVSYCIALYCIVLHCIVLYCIALHCILLYCIVLYCIVLYCIQARSQPVFSGKPGMISRNHFVCPLPSFSEMKEIGWRKVLAFLKNC